MAVLTPSAIYLLCRSAGWTAGEATGATAIALAESSGDPAVTSRNPDGGTNVGLFQLDTPGGKGAGYSVAQLQDPLTNATVAHKAWLADGSTFTKSWASANNGAAAKNQTAAQNAAIQNTGNASGPVNTVVGGLTSAVKLTEQAAGALAWLTVPANWGRIALVAVGTVLAIAGLNVVAKPVTAPVVNSAKKVAKIAAVA